MTWAKIDTGLHRNPKVRMAGADAREVFLYIVLANAEQCADGELPGLYAEPAFLADALQRDEETIRNALKRCETFRLLHVENGAVQIVGWDEEWRTRKSTDRVRKHRQRKKDQEVESDETLRNVTKQRGTTGNGEERVDRESRVDRDASRPPAEVTKEMLERAYSHYPLKKGKAKGLIAAAKIIKTREQYQQFSLCVYHMAHAFENDNSYCPHFSTFVNGRLWEDDEWPSPGKSQQQGTGRAPERIL